MRPEAVGEGCHKYLRIMETHILDCPKRGPERRRGLLHAPQAAARAGVCYSQDRSQRRARTVFGALSTAFSTLLTGEQRAAWNLAAKVLSRPRLGQCSPLTGQEHFVGINSSRACIDRDWLPWPLAPVVFGPNPVEALSLRYVDGRLRLELKLSRPVFEDIMVLAQAPCSPSRKKWRHGTCLGLLPAPQNGISEITEMYLEAFGEPEPGGKVSVRTRQQRNGWEYRDKDVSELVPVNRLAAHSTTSVPPARFPLPEPWQSQVPVSAAHRLPLQPLPVRLPCHRPMQRPCTRDPTIPLPEGHRCNTIQPGAIHALFARFRRCGGFTFFPNPANSATGMSVGAADSGAGNSATRSPPRRDRGRVGAARDLREARPCCGDQPRVDGSPTAPGRFETPMGAGSHSAGSAGVTPPDS